MKPTHIVIHHSLTKDSKTVSWGAIRGYHVKTLGWGDIGYHYGIEYAREDIEVLIGRMPDKSGAHCPQNGMNHRSIAICIVGNFDNSPVRDESWGKALKLCRHLCRMNNIPFENVTGHYEHNPSKTCPGKNWDMKKFRNDLAKGD